MDLDVISLRLGLRTSGFLNGDGGRRSSLTPGEIVDPLDYSFPHIPSPMYYARYPSELMTLAMVMMYRKITLGSWEGLLERVIV